MDELDILIDAVESYVELVEISSVDYIMLMFKATDIILKERDFHFIAKYKNKYSLSKCNDLVEEFLLSLNPEYLDYYRMRKDDGTIHFDYSSSDKPPYSCYDYENNRRCIYIPVTNTIEDAFNIVHELFHDINMGEDEDEDSYGRYFFTECLSYLGEILFSDFLFSKNVTDAKSVITNDLYYFRKKALEVNFNLRLIGEYLFNGYLDRSSIADIILSYPKKYFDDVMEIVYIICNEEELTLEDEETYVLSSLVATYMYDRIKKNRKYISELFDLNEVLNDYSLLQVLDYLDLDHDDFTLTDESYSVLHSKYKKFIKR